MVVSTSNNPAQFLDGVRKHMATIRCYQEPELKRLDHKDQPTVAQWQRQDGELEIVLIRHEHHATKASQRWTKQRKFWVEVFIVVAGAVTFSTVPQILGTASNRGAFAQSGGFIGGGAIAWLTHNRATKVLGKLRRRQDSQSALQAIAQEHEQFPVKNSMANHYFSAQAQIIRQVEADNLNVPFQADLVGAVAASVIEGGAAFLLTAPAGFAIASLAGGFPVLIIWLAALFQSEAVDLADAAADLEAAYEALIPSQDLAPLEAMQVHVLSAELKYLSEAQPSQMKTLIGVRSDAIATFCQNYLETLQSEAMVQIEKRLLQHREAVNALRNKYPEPVLEEVDPAGYRADQIPGLFEVAKERWQTRVEKEEQHLEQELGEDLKLLRSRCGQIMKPWQERKTKAESDFQAAEGE